MIRKLGAVAASLGLMVAVGVANPAPAAATSRNLLGLCTNYANAPVVGSSYIAGQGSTICSGNWSYGYLKVVLQRRYSGTVPGSSSGWQYHHVSYGNYFSVKSVPRSCITSASTQYRTQTSHYHVNIYGQRSTTAYEHSSWVFRACGVQY